MISYTDDEIKQDYLEALENKLLERTADITYNMFEPDEMDDDEIDNFNSEYLKANKPEILEQYIKYCQPGTYNCHEALDNTADLMNSVARLMEKDSIVANEAWFTMAHKAHTLLFNLYQEIGAVHLDAIPDNMIDLVEAQKKKNAE
jgi:hypothetical protein